ncbi:MAG: glycosyltransferase, partial [Eubacterium sp.]|nr:glycosyltransferase [Eubacterium sp.]
MSDLLLMLSKSFIFWLTWIIIPIIMEIIPAFLGFFILLSKGRKKKEVEIQGRYPEITIIVPIYNSEATLFGCIKSIAESTYPSELIEIYLVNNKSR